MNWSIFDVIFLISLLALAFIPKKKSWWILFIFVLAVNFGIRIYYIHNSHVLKYELQQTKELAQQPKLLLSAEDVDNTGENPILLLQFTPSKNEPLGLLTFDAFILEPESAKIISIDRKNTTSGPEREYVNPDGKSASISFSLISFQLPYLKLELSGPCRIRIKGSHLPDSIDIELFKKD
jgi:hypothetical protein